MRGRREKNIFEREKEREGEGKGLRPSHYAKASQITQQLFTIESEGLIIYRLRMKTNTNDSIVTNF